MDNLPDELLDHICSFLQRDDLWTVLQLSSRFRRLATLPYLSHFGISEASIQSGTLELADSLSPLPIVARIKPIQRLVYFLEGSQHGYFLEHCPHFFFPEGSPQTYFYQKLAYMLSAMAPIPDVVIHDSWRMSSMRNAARLLSCAPSSATNMLLVVKGPAIYLSRPRSAPPIHWIPFPQPPGRFRTLIIIFAIPLLFAYLSVINFAILLMWVYRRLFSPPWSQEERIILDTCRGPEFSGCMRIQILPGRLTLVTLTENWSSMLVLGPIRGLPPTAFSSLFASLDLGVHLQRLRLQTKTDLVHSELMAFLKRHRFLTELHVESDSIQSSSLTVLPIVPDPENSVQDLTAPSSYIPYLLPAAPNTCHASLLFTSVSKHASTFRRTTFDLVAYRSALTALAALPGTHTLRLTLTFSVTATCLPWHGLPDAEAIDAAQYPETRLERVNCLWLSNHGHIRYRASDIHALVRWLGLFPGLQRLTFTPGAVEKISAAECAVLTDAICGACRRIDTPQDIAFNVSH